MAFVAQAAIKVKNLAPRRKDAKAEFFAPLRLCAPFALLVAIAGCVHLPKTGSDEPMPHGAVCQITATWNHQVLFAPDPTHGGAPTPGLAGRLYLFGEEISYPLVEEGSLTVDLYDDTKPAANGQQPIPLEEWRLDAATLKRLVKRDMIGYGYTLFLPWGTYKPEINQVHLKLCFVTSKSMPFYAESGRLSLDKGVGPETHVTRVLDQPTEITAGTSLAVR